VIGGKGAYTAVGPFDLKGVGVGEPGLAGVDRNVVADVEAAAQPHLFVDNGIRAAQHLRKGEMPGLADLPEQGAGIELHHAADVVPQSLRRNGAPVSTAAADFAVAFDDGNAVAGFRQLHGGALAAGATADNDCVIVLSAHLRGSRDGVDQPAKRRSGVAATASEAATDGQRCSAESAPRR
jgi:hypothetical protein